MKLLTKKLCIIFERAEFRLILAIEINKLFVNKNKN